MCRTQSGGFCNAADQEGVNMTLTGNSFENPRPMCRTNHLNSPNVDYQNRGVFTAEPEEENWGWGSCYQVQNT